MYVCCWSYSVATWSHEGLMSFDIDLKYMLRCVHTVWTWCCCGLAETSSRRHTLFFVRHHLSSGCVVQLRWCLTLPSWCKSSTTLLPMGNHRWASNSNIAGVFAANWLHIAMNELLLAFSSLSWFDIVSYICAFNLFLLISFMYHLH